jgi:hypothetical protein
MANSPRMLIVSSSILILVCGLLYRIFEGISVPDSAGPSGAPSDR